jgi:ubiquinone/menaquinone biosynthesis C-methylase UbiE
MVYLFTMVPDYTATVQHFTGFAATYNTYRPSPPLELGEILPRLAGVKSPELVIDLGCGTGLSTRFWAEVAGQVIGIDPSPDMLQMAVRMTQSPRLAYLRGYAHQTGLLDGCADIVTCSQSFHWMEPQSTLDEIARLLRPGGIFAAYDYLHFPLLPDWRAETAYAAFQARAHTLEERHQTARDVPRWDKERHLQRIQESGHFRFTRILYLHQVVQGNAETLVGGALSYGCVQSLLAAGITPDELELEAFRAEAQRWLGDELRPWLWSYQVCIGIK